MGYSYEKDTVAGLESLLRENKDYLFEKLNVESFDSLSPDYSLKNNYRLQRELINCISDTQDEEIKKALLGEGLDDKERVSAILSL